MPRRHEGPTRSKATQYFYFDEFIGFYPNKKRVRISLRTQDPAKAQWLWEQEWKRQWGKFYGLKQAEKPTEISLVKAAEKFVAFERDTKKVKEWRTVESRLRIISECLGYDLLLKDIDAEKLTELDARLKAMSRSPKTINHYMGTLKTLFYYAIKKKLYTGDNPICDVKPYVVNGKRREYTPDELERIIRASEKVEREAWPNSPIQKRARRIVLLLLLTGMRAGELLNLKWENIAGDRIILKRSETKQRKEKIIPLTEGIRELLDSLRDDRYKSGYIIPRKKDRPIKAYSTKSLMDKIRKYAEIPDFVFHGLRHTASTLMVGHMGNGIGLADVMNILGHSKVETTMKYVHPDFDRMKRLVEKVEEKTKK